uniref:CCHC-type domain-containing protein n=1 Tax=Strigamia maritima TaxID=126957 RepID=T1IWB4_STRMM
MVRDCPDKIKLCYNCSTVGHLARDCPEPPKKRLKPDSPKKLSTNSPDSTKNDKACFACGSLDHLKQNCPKRNKQNEEKETANGNDDKKSTKEEKLDAGDKKSCWECGKTGHIARECPNPSESFKRKSRPVFDGPDRRRGSRDDACFRCGELGHFAKDCTGFHPRRPLSPRSPLHTDVYDLLSRALNKAKRDSCYVCGQPGHFARECPRNGPPGPAPFANIQAAPNGPFRGGMGGDCGPNFMPMQSHVPFNENLMVPEGLNVNNPCLTCGRSSHVTFDCPIAKLCYRCGMTNHIAKDCAGMGSMMSRDRMMSMDRFQGPPPSLPFNSINGEDRMKGDERCFRCGGRGHKSFECSHDKACYRCGRNDHEARDCFDHEKL